MITHTTTLGDAIAERAMARPNAVAMTFLLPDGATALDLTFGQLHTDAMGGADSLYAAGVRPGDIVLLAGEHDARLITLFVACLYAGATPTIGPYPTTFSRASLYQQRLFDVVRAIQAKAILALPVVTPILAGLLERSDCIILDLTVTSETTSSADTRRSTPSASPSTGPAYVQFSSGTTGTPKGAAVSHTAVLRHLQMLTSVLNLNENDVLIGWAPFYHDLGLVVYLLLPLISGLPAVTMSPSYWVRRPQILLRAIHKYRGTVCIMPNFGFAHITRNVRQRDVEDIDLRCMRHLIAGAEVVQTDTLHAFLNRFEPLGLPPEALRVGYGMTECVFMASLTRQNGSPRTDRIDRHKLLNDRRAIPYDGDGALPVISCGAALPSVTISVVNDRGESQPDRHVGEIVMASSSLFERYLHRPDLTEQVLRQDRLHTGDLGYMADGELFVVDRKRDLIVAAGKHIYPEALEQIALSVVGDAGGRAAAFGLRSRELGTELPVLVCEMRGHSIEKDATRLSGLIRLQVRRVTDVILSDVRIVRRGWLEITTSGKVSRSATREKYLVAGYRPEPPGLAVVLTANEEPNLLLKELTVLAADVLGVAEVQPDDNFFDIGCDSLTALRMLLIIEEGFGVTVPAEFFHNPTVAHLTRLISTNSDKPARLDVQSHAAPKRIVKSIPWQSRLKNILVHTGPIIRGRSLLPYGIGVRLQRSLLAAPQVQRTFFSSKISLLSNHSRLVGERNLQDAIQKSLMANTWVHWRNHVLNQPLGTSPWVNVQGYPSLWQLPRGGQGVIFMVMHSSLNWLYTRGLMARGFKPMSIRWQTGETESPLQDRALQIYRAHQVLLSGGTVIIAGDGRQGQQGVTVPFLGGQRLFRQGGAELAVQTGALLIPVFCSIAVDGRITIEVTKPLCAGDGSTQTRIKTLTHAYADLMTARWPAVYASMKWESLRRIINESRVTTMSKAF